VEGRKETQRRWREEKRTTAMAALVRSKAGLMKNPRQLGEKEGRQEPTGNSDEDIKDDL